MKLYFGTALMTDGSNSGTSGTLLWSEHMVRNLSVDNLHFRYFGEELAPKKEDRDYQRLSRLIERIK